MISALTCETQLLLVAASACWTLLTEEFSSQLHMLPAVASPLSLVRLKQSALWNLEERFKKGPARSFLCASLLLSPRLHFLSNSLTADMKRPADRNTDDEDAQLTGRYSALHPSCRHFLLHLHTDTHLQTVWCQTWTLQFSRLNHFLPSAADGSWKSDSTCRFVQTADDEEGWRSSRRDAHTCWRTREPGRQIWQDSQLMTAEDGTWGEETQNLTEPE